MRTVAWLVLGFLPASSSLLAQQAVTAAPTPHGVIATTQQRVDPTMTYHRVMAIVPLVGSGTAADPVRPMFTPAPQTAAPTNPQGVPKGSSQSSPPASPPDTLNNQQSNQQSGSQGSSSRPGIIAYQHQLSDNGTLSLVEFVAVDRSAFAELFASTDARVQYFEVGKSTQAAIQAAFQQKKAAFSFTTFHPLPVQ